MKALCWSGVKQVRVENVPDPLIINPRDAIIKVQMSAICEPDLHVYNGLLPFMRRGDILGREFLGEVVELGKEVRNIKKGDRVVAASVIGCGECHYCRSEAWSLCDNSNPNAALQEKNAHFSAAGVFGNSALFGGYAGSHAQYIRVPFADCGCFRIPDEIRDEQAVFLSDTLPTGYSLAEAGRIKPGDIVAVWGAGAIGQVAMQTAYLMGAEKVIAIDAHAYRLQAAARYIRTEVLDAGSTDVLEALKQATGGRGPDVCIQTASFETTGSYYENTSKKVRQVLQADGGRHSVLHQAVQACRKAGTLVIAGTPGLSLENSLMLMLTYKGVCLKSVPVHPQKFIPLLMDLITQQKLEPAFLFTHPLPLESAPWGYKILSSKKEHCISPVLLPNI